MNEKIRNIMTLELTKPEEKYRAPGLEVFVVAPEEGIARASVKSGSSPSVGYYESGTRKLATSILQRCLGAESEPHRIVMECK